MVTLSKIFTLTNSMHTILSLSYPSSRQLFLTQLLLFQSFFSCFFCHTKVFFFCHIKVFFLQFPSNRKLLLIGLLFLYSISIFWALPGLSLGPTFSFHPIYSSNLRCYLPLTVPDWSIHLHLDVASWIPHGLFKNYTLCSYENVTIKLMTYQNRNLSHPIHLQMFLFNL